MAEPNDSEDDLPTENREEGVHFHLTPTKTKLIGIILGVFVVGVIFNVIVGSAIFAIRIQEVGSALSSRPKMISSSHDESPVVGELSSAPLRFSCDFEGTLCDMEQSADDDFDWTHGRGSTSTLNTGPDVASSGKQYMFIEASEPCKADQFARLRTPTLQLTGPVCVRFAYHMYGIDTGRLELTCTARQIPHATFSGNQGDYWNIAEETMVLGNGDQVEFVGVCGVDIRGDIAIDQIYISEGQCPTNKYTGFNGRCGKVDLAFIIDNSGSILDDAPEKTYYADMKRFMKEIVAKMEVGPENSRIGAVRFANTASVEFNLDEHTSPGSLQTAIDNMPYAGGITNTAAGLLLARTYLFGSAADRPDVRNVAVLITDGQSSDDTESAVSEAIRAKDDGIVLIVVGVTKDMNEAELRAIASTPDNKYYVQSTDASHVERLLGEVMDFACHGDKSIPRRGDLPHQCGFEEDDCDALKNGDKDDQLAWERQQQTAPCPDNPQNGRFYMRVKVDDSNIINKTATLELDTIRWGGKSCVRFDYKLEDGGWLDVKRVGFGYRRTIFSSSTSDLPQEVWQRHAASEDFEYGERIMFKGYVDEKITSAVSLDNIKMEFGHCA